MRKVIVSMALLMIGAGFAFGYTFPGAWVYDGLITYDHGGMPVVPEALHFNVGAGYWMASERFDVDGEAQDLGGDIKLIAAPIDIGYAINDRILVDLTLQILNITTTPDIGDEASAMGLGDVWIKGRYIAPLDNDLYMGGRLGVKIPVGKVDVEDDDPELGDDQMDIDLGLVAGLYPAEGFAMNGQVGFRYRMDATVAHPLTGEDVDFTPGMLIYLDVEPGYTMGPDNFQVYVPIGYEMTMANKVDGEEATDSETSGLYVGVAPKYGIDANNLLGVKFLYPIMGKNVKKSMMFGLTYEGYLPL
jgi:hypothetical protein